MPESAYDGELGDAAAALRAAWRADEQEWTRAALEAWEHDRTLVDVARDSMHRGDTVAVVLGARTFSGAVGAVGRDFLRIRTEHGDVDIPVSAHPGLVLRIVTSARAGGARGDPDATTFRARLLQLEAAGRPLEIGAAGGAVVVAGAVRVGRDHVTVATADGARSYVSTGSVGWVRPVDAD